jgi:MFS family permease
VNRVTSFGHEAFAAAIEVPNYRRYISGQAVSLIGTWMQMTAQSWLVLQLTHSATTLGVIVALQTLPVLVLAPYGGVIADRVDKRKMMIALQSAMGVQALILGVLTVMGSETIYEIGALAVLLGFNNAFENPSRQSFMLELVGPEHLRNAVSLNSTLVNVARVVGPGIGGILIAVVGTGVCFLFNAASFVAVVYSLVGLNTTLLSPAPHLVRGKGQLLEGFAYVRRTPGLLIPLVMMGVVGCLTYEFQVSLPYMASRGLHAGSSGYGFMTAAMGAGAVVGGLILASRGRTGTRILVLSCTGFGVAMLLASIAPDLAFELLAMALVGAGSVVFMSAGNATLQLRSDPSMRGRVMALWFVAFQGSTPIGGPIVGATMSGFGARAGLGLGAVTCCVVAVAGVLAVRAYRLAGVDVNAPAPPAGDFPTGGGEAASDPAPGSDKAPGSDNAPRFDEVPRSDESRDGAAPVHPERGRVRVGTARRRARIRA